MHIQVPSISNLKTFDVRFSTEIQAIKNINSQLLSKIERTGEQAGDIADEVRTLY
jgi:hypothetical protein